ncbi:MAG: transporter substrate-binding domain-containing protein [Collinsella sp.]
MGDDGEYTGFDLDLARAVADELDWEVQLEAIDWEAKDALMDSGAINCIWNGFTMEGREDDYTFSDPYMLNAQVIVVRADSGISDRADLAGKTVVTQIDSARRGSARGRRRRPRCHVRLARDHR